MEHAIAVDSLATAGATRAILRQVGRRFGDGMLAGRADGHSFSRPGPNHSHAYPIRDFVYSRNTPIYDSPGGMSDLRAAYSDYWILDTVTKLRAIHAEKYTSPFMLGTYGNPAEKPSLEASLAAAKAGSWMAIPEDAKVQALTMAQSGESDYKSFSDDCKRGMLIAILGAYLQILEGQVSDGRGSAAVSKSITELYQWLLAVQIQEIFNRQIFPHLIDLNYAGVGYPRLTLGSVSEDELRQLLANFGAAQGLGAELSKKDFYQRTAITVDLLDNHDCTEIPNDAALLERSGSVTRDGLRGHFISFLVLVSFHALQ